MNTNGYRNHHRLARRLRRQHYRLAQQESFPIPLPSPAGPAPAHHAHVHKHLAAAEAEKMAEQLREQLLRLKAEFDNYRKRQRREEQQHLELAALGLIEQLLPVLDNFDRALQNPGDSVQALLSGVDMVRRQLHEILYQQGLEKIDPLGQPFDPNLHEAVSVEEARDGPDNQVLEVFRDGYRLKGRLIRPAMVKVARK